MVGFVRVIILFLAFGLLVGGLIALVAGQVGSGLWTMALGAAGLLAVAFERSRYRSQATESGSERVGPGGGEPAPPTAPFQATDERFVDPSTGRQMRVYVDPRSGERRYHAEG